MVANSITLDNWYSRPIHCPFCGTPLPPDQKLSCRHLIYIVANGNFVTRSDRFDEALGVAQDAFGPEFSREEASRIGNPASVASQVLASLPNGVEFAISGPASSAFVGFAALDDEMCGWGLDDGSPHASDGSIVSEQ